jgi:hypothetical protein
MKLRTHSRNACYYSVQNRLSSRILWKSLKIKMYINITLLFYMGVELRFSPKEVASIADV